jgi:ABC-type methionine transport system ATPase subunit
MPAPLSGPCNLDSATGESIMVLLRKIQQSLGMTIVLVRHERHLAEGFADRIASVADGKGRATGCNRP